MRVILISFAAIAVISVGAYFGLQSAGFSSSEQMSGQAVRLD
ncbi:MAG: hypothetical protein ACJAVR_003465 [Paracoccaceae bacterium]|jgi:hypothetical protein